MTWCAGHMEEVEDEVHERGGIKKLRLGLDVRLPGSFRIQHIWRRFGKPKVLQDVQSRRTGVVLVPYIYVCFFQEER